MTFLEFDVFRLAIGGAPFIQHIVEVDDDDLELPMTEFIRNKINEAQGRNSFVFLDDEIVHLKTGSGRIIPPGLLGRPVSEFQNMLLDRARNTWSIQVRINAQCTFGRGEGESNSGTSILVANANAGQSFLESKFTMEQLESFLQGYNECSTNVAKVRYIDELGDESITLHEQIKTLLCDFMTTNELGYHPSEGTTESQCEAGRDRVMRWLVMIRKHMSSLSVDNTQYIEGNCVLSRMASLRPTGKNDIMAKTHPTTAKKLRAIMEQIENESKRNRNCWPGKYYRKKATSDKQIGQAVIDLEEKIVRIVRRTINRLDSQAGRLGESTGACA